MNGTFCDQVGGVAGVFEGWSVCERTVVLCALLRRVPLNSLKLIRYAIDAALSQNVSAEAIKLEKDANDPTVITECVQEEDVGTDVGERLQRIISFLPLLQPGNEAAKEAYLKGVPILVKHCVSVYQHMDECQQMLSYMLIHPAITCADRRSLTQWLRYLENYISTGGKSTIEPWQPPRAEMTPPQSRTAWPTNGNQAFRRTIGKNFEFKDTPEESVQSFNEPICIQVNNDILHESFSKNGTEIELNGDIDKVSFDPVIIQPKTRRSNSLTPPSSSYNFISSSAENLNDQHFVQKPRSFSLSSEHSLLNVKTLGGLPTSSGSETRLDDLKYNNVGEHGGMSTVAHWLKTLRLHKYIWLFSNISYDQMISINDEYLQRLGVTKGARHKLLLSIKKLSERQTLLEGMEMELQTGAFVNIANMTALLEQLRAIVISPIKPDSPLATLVVRVLDLASSRLLSNGASYQDGGAAVALHCWLVDRALSHDAFSRSATLAAELKSLKYRVPPRQFIAHLGEAPFQRRPKPRWRACLTNGTWQSADCNRKSSSYPSFPPTALPRPLPPAASMGDINSRLESLCLQMTEQAIN